MNDANWTLAQVGGPGDEAAGPAVGPSLNDGVPIPEDAPRTWAEVGSSIVAWWRELPEQVGEMLPYLVFSLGKTVLVLLLALVAYRVVASVLRRLERSYGIDHAITAALRILLRWVVAALTIAAVVQAWELVENFWTAMTTVVALIAIGFVAVWSVLSNISCSVMLLTTRMFRIGDRVELLPDKLAGKVVAVTLLYTTLEDADGDELNVPNNLFFQRVVKRSKGAASRAIEGEAAGSGARGQTEEAELSET
jgi:small-conductance mechanosensitive channel